MNEITIEVYIGERGSAWSYTRARKQLQTTFPPRRGDEIVGLFAYTEGECSLLVDSVTFSFHEQPVVNIKPLIFNDAVGECETAYREAVLKFSKAARRHGWSIDYFENENLTAIPGDA